MLLFLIQLAAALIAPSLPQVTPAGPPSGDKPDEHASSPQPRGFGLRMGR